MNRNSRLVLTAAAVPAAIVGSAHAGTGITLPDFGVDGAGIVTALTTEVGPGITAAVGLGMGIFAVTLVVRMVKRFASR